MASSEWMTEGKAQFRVATAFYRQQSKIGRDLAILAAAVYRRQRGGLRVLDAMTGCGVRPLRYQQEAGADWVWANEANPDLHALLTENLAQGMRPRTYRLTHQDANQLFFTCHQQRDFYDLVDIDSFGSPGPFLSTGLWATKLGGLLYLTSTDGRATSGHAPDKALQTYGAYARSHPAVHEQGLRLLISGVGQQAAARGLQIQPIFSFFNGHVHRVMVRLALHTAWTPEQSGFLAYCHSCGQFQTVTWTRLGRVDCVCHTAITSKALAYVTPLSPVISGPLWLGPLHDGAFLTDMVALATDWDWPTCVKLLNLMRLEAEMPPYYYPLGEIGRRGQLDIPQRDRLIQGLCDRNYRTTRTHLDFQAIKTEAPMTTCIEVAKSL